MTCRLPRTLLAIAGVALLTIATSSAIAADAAFEWKDNPEKGVCNLYYGDQPVLQYFYTVDESSDEAAFDTAKVFHHVYGPGTDDLITKGPGGKFPHHRGLYVGWNKTTFDGRTEDFWHCRKGERLRHVRFEELAADNESATMTAVISWNDSDGKPVIEEHRTVEVRKLPVDARPGYGWQIDWSTTLHSKRGEITLKGDRQHAGFQYRAAQYVAEANNATYVRPEGHPQQPAPYQVDDRKEPNQHVDLGWLAMTYELNGKRYTIEYMESPATPSPSRYSERPYGRFGAFFEAEITEEEPLEMTYRVNVVPGPTPDRETVQKRYNKFTASLEQ
ncbi:MAG: DUF6807 family protein [Maioricimonas sp. JB049]